jgi:hypothetical protein
MPDGEINIKMRFSEMPCFSLTSLPTDEAVGQLSAEIEMAEEAIRGSCNLCGLVLMAFDPAVTAVRCKSCGGHIKPGQDVMSGDRH